MQQTEREKITPRFTLRFTGYSMYPILRPGDLLIVKSVPPLSLQVGDIIVIHKPNGRFVVHRLVRIISKQKGITKGDSLLSSDPEHVRLSSVIGRVDAIARGDRLILVSTGPRSWLKRLYALLSLKGLTFGALKLKAKALLQQACARDTTIRLDSEKRFMIAILTGDSYESVPNVNWEKLAKVALKEGVAGILYHHLKDRDIPLSVLSPLEHHYHTTAGVNIVHMDALDKIERALAEEEIEVLVLQGASLLNSVYPRIGMRPMEDLDLMVHSYDRDQFVQLLCRIGYKQNPRVPHCFSKGKTIIDLHIHALNIDRIVSRASLFPAGMAPFWAATLSLGRGFRWLRRPDDADNVLLLAQHIMKHSFSRLIWLVDIYLLLKSRKTRFWTKLAERARLFGQQRALSYVLYLLKQIFDVHPPEAIVRAGLLQRISSLEKRLLRVAFESHQPFTHLGPLLSLPCLPGFKERLKFGWETLFPKGDVLDRELGSTLGKGRAFLYPIRFLQMATLIFNELLMMLGIFVRGTK